MKSKLYAVAIALTLATLARGATNDLTGLLQQGLFEEEANRNLDAAIAQYQSLAGAFDKDRQTAATAIFRLGECYRKLGKTNEAVAQYQRILRDFSDQQALVTLSRQNLNGLAAGESTAAALSSRDTQQLRQQLIDAEAQLAKDQSVMKTLKGLDYQKLKEAVPGLFPDPQLDSLETSLNQAKDELVRLKVDYTTEHPKYKAAEEVIKNLDEKIQARINGILLGLETKIDAETAYLNALKTDIERTQVASSSPNGNDVLTRLKAQRETESKASANAAAAPVTDEEEKEIRRIQVMIQDSPDLINAPGADNKTPLQTAAEKGQLTVARYLLDHGANVNGVGNLSGANAASPPLYLAAVNGHKAMVELLVSRGAQVNGWWALYRAVSKGYTAVALTLLEHGADPNSPGDRGQRPLHVAASDGETNLIQALLNHGADVTARSDAGDTPLHLAAWEGQINAARLLLAAKAPIDATNYDGDTPLHRAAARGQAAMVSLLIESGAAVDAIDKQDATPLLLAADSRSTNTVRELLAHKADPNHEGRIPNGGGNYTAPLTAVYPAIWTGHSDILKLLLDAGANPEGIPGQSYSPLYYAIAYRDLDSVRLLLQHGANPNRVDNATPLLAVALSKPEYKPSIPLLLDQGADPNATNRDGLMPLFLTTDPEIGRWLVDHKANVNGRLASDGQTPLMRAWGKTTNYTKFLLEAGANPDLQDTNGNTALHYAVYFANPVSITLLLEHKANPNIQNEQGFTPLDIVKSGNSSSMSPGARTMFYSMLNPHVPSTESIGVEQAKQIEDLLVQAGGLADLPKRNRIEVKRAPNASVVITKDAHNWNQFTVLESIAFGYGLLQDYASGEWHVSTLTRPVLFSSTFRFPNFKKTTVYRRTDNSPKQTAINVDVEDIFKTGDCSRDTWLKWGDVIEIPEADHPVDEKWPGLSDQEVNALIKCVSRQVVLKIKGESTTLTLAPTFVKTSTLDENGYRWSLTRASFMLRSVLDNSKLVRVSSDLSRVKVTRVDPATKKTVEWTVDCTHPDQANLWLRDGDVIDVPEK